MFSRKELKTLTTDVVATFAGRRNVPVHVKYKKDLQDRRNQELREIEKTYWQQRGEQLVVATEDSVVSKVVNNLKMLRSYEDENVRYISDQWLMIVIQEARHSPIRHVLRELEAKVGVPYETQVDRLKASIACGRVRLDLSRAPLRWSDVWPAMSLIRQQLLIEMHRSLELDF